MLKLHRVGRVIPAGGAIASPQADAIWRGLLCLRRTASAAWGMTQHRDPGGCSFSFLPRAICPRVSSHISSPPCIPSARAQGKWLQLKFYVGPLRCSLSLQLSLPGRQKPPLLFTAGCYLCSFSSFMLRSPTWGLDPTLLRGNPLATKLSL